MYRVIIQQTSGGPDEMLETIHEMQSNDTLVVAEFLRAVANQLDPKKLVYVEKKSGYHPGTLEGQQ
jgi:hypothetical protein